MRRFTFVYGIAFGCLALLGVSISNAPPPTAPPRIVPLLTLDAAHARFTYLFQNSGSTPIYYLPIGEHNLPFGMSVSMSTLDDVYLRSIYPIIDVAINRADIQPLASGKVLPVDVNLNRHFGKLSPGRYAVHIKALGGPANEGLTPYRVETDFYVDIEANPATKPTSRFTGIPR
jgi:hypothetical protein